MSRDFEEADKIRDQLQAAGIRVDDRAKQWTCTDGRSGDIPSGGGFSRGDKIQPDGSMSWANTIYVSGLPPEVRATPRFARAPPRDHEAVGATMPTL